MGGSHKVPQGYQPTGQPQADTAYQQITQSQLPFALNLPGQVIPQAQGLSQSLVNNPYAAGAQDVAGQVANIGTTQVAPMDFGNASGLSAFAGEGQGLASSIIGQAFDPQSALYNRMFQQTLDQQNVVNSMYGLSTSPYGAGLTSDALRNFNIDWQNNLLQRMISGANAYGGLLGDVGSAYGQAGNLGAQGLRDYTASGLLPYEQFSQNVQQGISGLGSYADLAGASMQPGAGVASELATYLGLGQSATQNAQNAVRANNAASAGALSGFGNLVGNAVPFALSF